MFCASPYEETSAEKQRALIKIVGFMEIIMERILGRFFIKTFSHFRTSYERIASFFYIVDTKLFSLYPIFEIGLCEKSILKILHIAALM